MSAREFIFDELVVLCTHACLRERLAKSPQRWGNAHQGYAQVAHFHFDRVEEPDGPHGPAPFFTSHSKYLGSFIDLFACINPHQTRRLDATSLFEKTATLVKESGLCEHKKHKIRIHTKTCPDRLKAFSHSPVGRIWLECRPLLEHVRFLALYTATHFVVAEGS